MGGKNLIPVQGTTWRTLFDFLLFVLERTPKKKEVGGLGGGCSMKVKLLEAAAGAS